MANDAQEREVTMNDRKTCWTTVVLQVQGLCLAIMTFYYPLRLSLAFSQTTFFLTRRQIHRSKFTSTLELFAADTVDMNHHETLLKSFNPLGPNPNLTNLPTGQSLQLHDKQITRLSSSPDIFLVKDLIHMEDRNILMKAANSQGMKVAGTRSSGENTVRKNSYLAWIDPHSITCSSSNNDEKGGDYWKDASSVARETILKSRMCFVHDTMNDLINTVEKMEFCFAEDLQVAKYNEQGMFDYHHDGYSRYLTVLTYLNGVGGTYFPFGNMGDELLGINFTNETEVSVLKFKKNLDKCGILIVGEEGSEPYLKSSFVKPKNIIHIKAGDAIAFYNYMPGGEKDLRQIHCSLPVPQEKWISTSWFRSEALTGPFAALKKMQLFEEESSSLCGADTHSVG